MAAFRIAIQQMLRRLTLQKCNPTRLGITPEETIVVAASSEGRLYFGNIGNGQLMPWTCRLSLNGGMKDCRQPQVLFRRPRLLGIDKQGNLYIQNIDHYLLVVRFGKTVDLVLNTQCHPETNIYGSHLLDLELRYGIGTIGYDWFGGKWLLDQSSIRFNTAPLWELLSGPRPMAETC